MELAYGGVAIIVQEAEQHHTCLDKLHSVCRQQMQKSAVRKQNEIMSEVVSVLHIFGKDQI